MAVIALAEVARALRYLNLLFGAWVVASPFLLAGADSSAAVVNNLAVGVLIVALSLPRGKRSREHYGSWDKLVV